MNSTEDKGVHDGHRARMRAKFSAHGATIFDTYELLEMLLYHVIPVRDTNPIAKGLLSRFGSLSAVLRATAEELSSVAGVGERAAALIGLVANTDTVCLLSREVQAGATFNEYLKTGKLICRYFREHDPDAAIFLLDDTMRLLGAVNIPTPRFGSAATRPAPFIDAALRYGATVAVIGFTHRNGAVYPYSSDIVTCRMLASELAAVGVYLAESYIVDGERFSHVGPRHVSLKNAPTPEMASFARSRPDADSYEGYDVSPTGELEESVGDPSGGVCRKQLTDHLSELLSYAIPRSEDRAVEALVDRFGSLDAILTQSADILKEDVTERGAQLLKLVAAIMSRSITDDYAMGALHTDEDTVRYITATLYASPVERLCMLSFDSRGRVKGCDLLGEGTVNASEVYPRKIAECAVRRGASSVILAHNHPSGVANASDDDISATLALFATLRSMGIRLYRHVVVAGRDHFVIEPDEEGREVNKLGRVY